MDLGQRTSYLALAPHTKVYSADGQEVGKLTHVMADEAKDMFEGIIIAEHLFGEGHRFVDAEQIEDLYAGGIVLKLEKAACDQLPKPSKNPGVMRADPAESESEFRHQKLRRAWDLLSGK